MALTPRRHGVTQTEVLKAAAALDVKPTSIWGVSCNGSDADAAKFPAGQPVLVTDLDDAINDAGELGGLARTLQAIRTHGKSIGVVVRVADGVGGDAGAIATDQAAKAVAGIQALRTAETRDDIRVRPRILAAPGLDVQSVTTAAAVAAAALGAFAYGSAVGATPANVETYRANFSARELMLIDGDFRAFDEAAGEDAVSFAVAHAVGLRARIDREIGWHKTLSNVPFTGPSGIVSPRAWDLFSPETDMGLINGADVTGLIRRDGYRFWGNRTCSANPQFAFESAVRTNQVLRDTIGEGMFPYIDRPLTNALATDIVELINALFRRLTRAGLIIGAEAFLAAGNTKELLAAGKLKLGYRFTPCAPMEDLGVESEITDEFYADTFNLAA